MPKEHHIGNDVPIKENVPAITDIDGQIFNVDMHRIFNYD